MTTSGDDSLHLFKTRSAFDTSCLGTLFSILINERRANRTAPLHLSHFSFSTILFGTLYSTSSSFFSISVSCF
jgi:hypothetical protein